MKFKVGCAQFAPSKSQVPSNLDHIAQIIHEANHDKVDLLVLPEAATSGYFLEGGIYESSLTAEGLTKELATRLGKTDRSIDFALGFYEQKNGEFYNSAAYFEWREEKLEQKFVYHKFFLPTYGLFDEKRFSSRGTFLGTFDSRFGKLGLLICEDIWHSILPTLCALEGVNMLLIPSASPARGFEGERPENLDRYERLLRGIAEEHGIYCINAMLCGFEGGKGFVGGSMIVNPFGAVIARAKLQEEQLLTTEIDLELVHIARMSNPLLSDLKSQWANIEKIIEEMRDK